MTTYIRRYVETDTGHRVPNHKSKCKHMHGHRYRFEAEIEGDVVTQKGVSEEGMLMDFSDIPWHCPISAQAIPNSKELPKWPCPGF